MSSTAHDLKSGDYVYHNDTVYHVEQVEKDRHSKHHLTLSNFLTGHLTRYSPPEKHVFRTVPSHDVTTHSYTLVDVEEEDAGLSLTVLDKDGNTEYKLIQDKNLSGFLNPETENNVVVFTQVTVEKMHTDEEDKFFEKLTNACGVHLEHKYHHSERHHKHHHKHGNSHHKAHPEPKKHY